MSLSARLSQRPSIHRRKRRSQKEADKDRLCKSNDRIPSDRFSWSWVQQTQATLARFAVQLSDTLPSERSSKEPAISHKKDWQIRLRQKRRACTVEALLSAKCWLSLWKNRVRNEKRLFLLKQPVFFWSQVCWQPRSNPQSKKSHFFWRTKTHYHRSKYPKWFRSGLPPRSCSRSTLVKAIRKKRTTRFKKKRTVLRSSMNMYTRKTSSSVCPSTHLLGANKIS